MNALHIRRATIQDADLIVRFIEALAEYEKLRTECVVTSADVERHLFGERPVAEVLIGEINGDPAGFALFFTTFSTFVGKPGLYLEDLFVEQEARGKGLGKALLLEVVRLARSRNCGRVEWSVLDWNSPAIEFYRKLGAVPMEGWTVNRLTESAMLALVEAD